MKAKAASKSTNWNLRVMASRSFTSSQSGSRFKALRNSSIVNFGIVIASQGIFLLYAIDAAVAGQLAGIETERIHGEFAAGGQSMIDQPFAHLVQFGIAQPRDRHMRRKFVGVLRL